MSWTGGKFQSNRIKKTIIQIKLSKVEIVYLKVQPNNVTIIKISHWVNRSKSEY